MIRVSFEVMEWDEYFFGESVEEDEKVATHYFAGSDQFIELDKVTGVWSSHGTEPYEGKYKDEVMDWLYDDYLRWAAGRWGVPDIGRPNVGP